MKLNLFKVKKWLGFVIAGILPVIFFIFIILFMGDLIMATVFIFIGLVLSAIIGSLFIRHPMLQMLEGQGLLTLTLDSTGTIDSFIVGVNPPYIKGYFGKKEVNTTFDRDMVGYLAVPKMGKLCKAKEIDENGNIVGECEVLKMPKPEEKAENIFSFGSFPVFIFNKNLGVFLSKDVLASNEKDTMIKHVILYLLRKTEDLTNSIRDFARHVVEQTKPKKPSILKNRLLMIVIIIIIILIMVGLFAPSILEALGPMAGGGSGTNQPTPIPFIKGIGLR